MNLSEARGALANRGFDYLSGASMNLILNFARNDLEDYWDWPWLRTTVIAPTPITLNDLKYIRLVKDGYGNELLGLEDRVAGMGATPTASVLAASGGRWWYLRDSGPDNTVLDVTPNGTVVNLTVAYTVQSPELTADNDVPRIPARYHGLWIDHAVVHAYKDSDNFPAAQALRQDIETRLRTLVERYEVRNRQHSTFMAIRALSEDE